MFSYHCERSDGFQDLSDPKTFGRGTLVDCMVDLVLCSAIHSPIRLPETTCSLLAKRKAPPRCFL